MEVVEGIHRIEAPLGDRRFCAFLIAGDHGTVLVDTGVATTPQETLLPYLDAAGLAPDSVVISHADFDHHGGNGPLAAAFPQARFACHPADRAQIEDPELLISERYNEFDARYGVASDPAFDSLVREASTSVPIDVELRGGERLRIGADRWLDVLHVPGHSRGHLALFDASTQTAIVADAVLREAAPTVAGSAAIPPTYRYVDAYRATIAHLRGLRAQRLLTSHFLLVEGAAEVDCFLDETSRYVDRVERALLDELAQAPAGLTLPQLIERLGTQLGDWPAEASGLLSHPLAGHLEQLWGLGTVRAERDGDTAPVFKLRPRS
jgi:glyoxylase-like metal-dependent hydrolase (beta-lactamase superfamily II)